MYLYLTDFMICLVTYVAETGLFAFDAPGSYYCLGGLILKTQRAVHVFS
jgi:hypothetical protein